MSKLTHSLKFFAKYLTIPQVLKGDKNNTLFGSCIEEYNSFTDCINDVRPKCTFKSNFIKKKLHNAWIKEPQEIVELRGGGFAEIRGWILMDGPAKRIANEELEDYLIEPMTIQLEHD